MTFEQALEAFNKASLGLLKAVEADPRCDCRLWQDDRYEHQEGCTWLVALNNAENSVQAIEAAKGDVQ